MKVTFLGAAREVTGSCYLFRPALDTWAGSIRRPPQQTLAAHGEETAVSRSPNGCGMTVDGRWRCPGPVKECRCERRNNRF
jgi:hypothetical protein